MVTMSQTAAHQWVAAELRWHGLDAGTLIGAVRHSFGLTGKPYHGMHHCLLVAVHAQAGAQAHGLPDPQHFLVAGLFHDAGHHSSDDGENIATALAVWEDAIYRCRGEAGVTAAIMKHRVRDLIRATEYPWTRDDLPARVMTDADILGSAVDQSWCDRLTQETGIAGTSQWALDRLRTDYGRNFAGLGRTHEEDED